MSAAECQHRDAQPPVPLLPEQAGGPGRRAGGHGGDQLPPSAAVPAYSSMKSPGRY